MLSIDDSYDSKLSENFLYFLAPFLLDQNPEIYSLIYKGKNAEENLFELALRNKDIKLLKIILSKKSKKELFNMLSNSVFMENVFLTKVILYTVNYDIDNHIPLYTAILHKNRPIIEHLLVCKPPNLLNIEMLRDTKEFSDLLPPTETSCIIL